MLPVSNYSKGWFPTLFNDFLENGLNLKMNQTAPAINVKETDTEYDVELAAPGLKKEDFTVHLNEDGTLCIKMERKQEDKEEDKKAHYLRREFSYTSYEQNLILPDDIDKQKISAKVENGVLLVQLPKVVKEEQKVSRQIEIG